MLVGCLSEGEYQNHVWGSSRDIWEPNLKSDWQTREVE